uniref:LysM domain-containing protein n=1 Tax=Panagrolaimus sp. ES5 TaxID=591445 RepID=A0AC34F3X2_9BILA
MEYQVRDHDTLERIAACHDCTVGELVKLNKMHSRMVFPGQRIRVPVPQDPTTANTNPSATSLNSETTSDGYTLISTASPPQSPLDNPIKPPGSAVRQMSTISYQSTTTSPHRQSSITSGHVDAEDTDCLRRFLKVKVKQVTESDGTVTGTLLITPNCIMFDPDLVHPLVKENGPDLYGMVANMDDIVSVSVFKHDHSLVDNRESETSESKKLSFDCGPTEDDYRTAEDTSGDVFCDAESVNTNSSNDFENSNHINPPLSLTMSIDPQLPSIQEEGHVKSTPTPDNAPMNSVNSLDATVTKRRAISDAGVIPNDPDTNNSQSHQQQQQNPPDNSNVPDRPRAYSDLQPSSSLDSEQQQKSGFSRFSPSMTRRSFGRLGRTLSSRANSLKGTVTSGAQTVASGTQKVAHGVVTHTKSAAGHIQSGIETSVKTVAAVPTSIVNVGSEILQEGQDLYGSFVAELKGEPPKSPIAIKREKSLATLESLRQKTHEARMTSINQNNIDSVFTKASINDESHDLFPSIDSMSTSINPPVIGTPPDPPMYMTIRVDRKRMTKKKRINYEDALTGNRHASVSSTSDDLSFGNRRRCEFWFAIPRTSADAIYHFLLIWSPGHQQPEEAETTTNENNTSRNSLTQEPGSAAISNTGIGSKKGLIVLDSNSEDPRITAGGRIDEQNWFGATFGSGLIREWEIITVRELCRRLSLDQEVSFF